MEEAEEIKRIFQEVNDGNWIPLTIVAVVLGVVLALIIYIWKQSEKLQEQRYIDAKEERGEQREWLIKLSEIVNKLEMWIEFHEKDHDKRK